MPKIPTYSSSQQINTNINIPAMREQTPTAGIAAGESIQKTGDLVNQYIQHFADLKDQQQVMQAENIASERLNSIYQQYGQDPDYNNIKKYHDEIDKSVLSLSSSIENNEYKNRFQQQVMAKSISVKNSISELSRNRLIDAYKADYVFNKENSINEIINDQNSETKSYNTLLLNKRITEMGEQGIISREDAAKEKIDTAKRIRVGEVKLGISVSPDNALSELEKGEQGLYKHLTIDERQELTNNAREQIKRNKQVQKDDMINKRLDVFNQYVQNPDQFKDPNVLNQLSIKDPELGEAIRKGSDTNKFMTDTDDEEFAKTVKDVFNAGSKEEISEFLMNVLNANDNRTISGDKLAIIVNVATERANELKIAKDAENKVLSPKQTAIDSYVKTITNMVRPITKEERNKFPGANFSKFNPTNMLVNFFQGLSAGKTPEQAHKEAVKSEFQRSGLINNVPKEGKILQDKFGNKVRVMPDGTVEEIK